MWAPKCLRCRVTFASAIGMCSRPSTEPRATAGPFNSAPRSWICWSVWRVTAVKSGVHAIKYKVAAGLDGKAKAVLAGGNEEPAGSFTINVSGKPASARVGANGQVITEPAE